MRPRPARRIRHKIDIFIRLDLTKAESLSFCVSRFRPEVFMRAFSLLFSMLFVAARVTFGAPERASSPEWAMNATIIEACSCPMFCQWYFNDKPAGHGAHD